MKINTFLRTTYGLLSFILFSCQNKIQADLLIINAKVYTVNAEFSITEAFVVKDGLFLDTGTTKYILGKYASENIIDMEGKPVYPGFIDAHCHFWGYAENIASRVNLSDTYSFEEVIIRLSDFQKRHPDITFLQGFGWNSEAWRDDTLFKERLDRAFPDIPVYLTHIGGHAALVNSAALKISELKKNQNIEGGDINWEQGFVLDNSMAFFTAKIPKTPSSSMITALQQAQYECFQYGLTSVQDAGLDKNQILLIDSLQKSGILKMNVYAMINATSENLKHFVENGIIETNQLTIRCIKMYADGTLGSRGALLAQPYSDIPEYCGLWVTSTEEIENICRIAFKHQYQMAVHCIGDSANTLMLDIFSKFLPEKNKRRWRIEHAQIVNSADLQKFHDYQIIPSVQPTHALSDRIWVEDRIGKNRLKNAYCYHSLLQTNGWMPLGTDFPVEKIDPKLTFFAAATRKDGNGMPKTGFFPKQALNKEESLRGITIWAAKAAFEEHKKGSIEKGKNADFVVFNLDIMSIPEHEILKAKVLETWVKGERVK